MIVSRNRYCLLAFLCGCGFAYLCYCFVWNVVQIFSFMHHWVSHMFWYLLYTMIAVLSFPGAVVCGWLTVLFADKALFMFRLEKLFGEVKK